MGFWGFVADAIGLSDFSTSYDQGENWANRIIAKHPEAEHELPFEVDFEVDQEFISGLADEYGKDADGFYAGFRDTWNEQAVDETPRKKFLGLF